MSFSSKSFLVGIILIILLLVPLACGSDAALPDPGLAGATPALSENDTAPWIQIYFTNPKAPAAGTYRGGPDQDLAEAILAARVSVDLAVLDLNLWSIRDALLIAHRNGVAVRLVVESDYLDETEIQDIKDAGIPVLGDRREGLMHNKFVVIDRSEIWTGSMNYTTRDGYRNNNNLLRIRSSRLAANYTAEFEEMFVDDLFGQGSPANTPDPLIEIDGTVVETYFSPDDAVADRLVELIQGAGQSVLFMAYSFTSDELAEALRSAASRGVLVRGVMESSQIESNQGGEYASFRAAGLDVVRDGNSANMHHKILIIDGKIVVAGSYNFSRNAEQVNDENVLIIHNDKAADLFQVEFEHIYADATE